MARITTKTITKKARTTREAVVFRHISYDGNERTERMPTKDFNALDYRVYQSWVGGRYTQAQVWWKGKACRMFLREDALCYPEMLNKVNVKATQARLDWINNVLARMPHIVELLAKDSAEAREFYRWRDKLQPLLGDVVIEEGREIEAIPEDEIKPTPATVEPDYIVAVPVSQAVESFLNQQGRTDEVPTLRKTTASGKALNFAVKWIANVRSKVRLVGVSQADLIGLKCSDIPIHAFIEYRTFRDIIDNKTTDWLDKERAMRRSLQGCQVYDESLDS